MKILPSSLTISSSSVSSLTVYYRNISMNVKVARSARNDEWDFFCDFQTLCVLGTLYFLVRFGKNGPFLSLAES